MKDRIDAILRRSQAEYLDSLLAPRDALLEHMEKFAEENDHPIADPEVAQLLRALVRMKRPRHRLLEVGTNIGYSVITLGRECGPGGHRDDRDRSQHIEHGAPPWLKRRCRAGVFHEAPRSTSCRASPVLSTSSSSIA
jgi:hypothetical protein